MLLLQSALRWVQREIHHFGGDRARVGLFGQSSGGEAVEVLTIAPSSKGLFIGSVSQSGGMEARPLADAVATTRILAAQVNCTGAAILECMRAADPLQVIAAAPKCTELRMHRGVGKLSKTILC